MRQAGAEGPDIPGNRLWDVICGSGGIGTMYIDTEGIEDGGGGGLGLWNPAESPLGVLPRSLVIA